MSREERMGARHNINEEIDCTEINEKDIMQTWESFNKICKNKKIFLFGVGNLGSKFIAKYHNEICIDGIIDNDVKKQGWYVGDFVAEALTTRYQNIVVSDISILEKYNYNEIVVLVTIKTNYELIVKQLREIGIKNIYIYFLMGDNKKIVLNDVIKIDEDKKREDYFQECSKQEINKNKVIVSIGNYGGHGKYITQKLLELNPDLDIVWIVNELATVHPEKVRLIYEGNWKKYMYEMETAHIWIFDILLPKYIRKRKGQIYIQTKHWSSVTLKKFFLDDSSTIFSKDAIEWVRYNGKIMDYIFTGSEFDNKSCRSGFAFQGKFVQIGSARTDAVFRPENRDKVYEKYSIDKEVHSVLYAPTFRFDKNEKKKHFDNLLDYKRVKGALEKRFGGKWVILLRIHPSLTIENEETAQESYLIDVSDYNDSQELVAASDIMISDYSSIMFESAFAHKPVFLFAPDREQYVNNERELLIDYAELPFPMAETNDELIQDMENFNLVEYETGVKGFMEKYGVHEDGHASERAAQYIVNLLGKCEKEN